MPEPTPMSDAEVRRQSGRRTRRSFLTGGIVGLAGLAGWQWLRTASLEEGIPWPLRRVLELNERIAGAAFGPERLAPTFAAGAAAADMRINGQLGLDEVDPANWSLRVSSDGGAETQFSLADVQRLPRTTMITELRCIEGWSQVIAWGGVRLRDFMIRHRLGTRSGAVPDPVSRRDDLYRCVSLETPNGGYTVALDMASALHPQTLLCDEMGNEPLTPKHGAPLRLAIPVKYGIKSLKGIGRIRFTDVRPTDYWTSRGYDWYAGH
ncbi:MAG TPA: molybdopterin-dependent oxidoreductase [Gemmataceae bacterium]|jgi:DMSO/TMAO reductase YedYZ molybdopterin-dependent catalytic subunit|nr:molybdopterin-dependent oxidoreductase [Gemmataceae bacterium]